MAQALATGAPADGGQPGRGRPGGGSDHLHLEGLIPAVEEVGRRNGYLLFVAHTGPHPEREVAYARQLRVSRAGGLLLLRAPGGAPEDDPARDSAARAVEVAVFQGAGGRRWRSPGTTSPCPGWWSTAPGRPTWP